MGEEIQIAALVGLEHVPGVQVFVTAGRRRFGFKTAFVRRPDEWGPEGPPDPAPNPAHDIVVDSFPELAEALGVVA